MIMTRTTRRFLFYGLFIVFIPLSIAVILYSIGWQLNLENCSNVELLNCLGIRKTGAIYIETKPKSVKIEINREIFTDNAGILQSGTLISNLPPKTYEVKIEKDGYLPYYKNIAVQPSLVAELIDTVLIPQKINEIIVIENKLKGDKIAAFDENNEKLIIENSKTRVYYLYDLKNLSSSLNINILLNNAKKNATISKIAFYPYENNKLIIEENSSLYSMDIAKRKIEPIFPKNNSQTDKIIAWIIKNANVYYITEATPMVKINEKATSTKTINTDKNYQLNSFNLTFKKESVLFALPEKIKPTGKIDVSDSEKEIAFVDSLDDLYIFNIPDNNLNKIAHNAGFFSFSPDSKKITFTDKSGQLNVYFTEDWYKNSAKKAGDVARFIYAEKPSEISNIYWYQTSYHLLAGYENNIEFSEIDSRSPLNKYKLVEADDFYYEGKSSKIYFIQKEKLYSFEI